VNVLSDSAFDDIIVFVNKTMGRSFMKKIIVIAITAIVSLAIGVFIGAKMMTHRLDNDAD